MHIRSPESMPCMHAWAQTRPGSEMCEYGHPVQQRALWRVIDNPTHSAQQQVPYLQGGRVDCICVTWAAIRRW